MSHELGSLVGGKYKIHELCTGRFGDVLLCMDITNNRFCALKTIKKSHFSDLEVRRAFHNEVDIWVSLHSHQNIVRCRGLEVHKCHQFIVLDWVFNSASSKADLRSYIQEHSVSTKQAIQWIIDVCWGLFYAQNKHPGLVHGDIKPENILLYGDYPIYAKLTDFGLARILPAKSNGPAEIAGSPLYMAPELWLGAGADQRTDIYAIGCVLFELLTGRPPFRGSSMGECKQMHLSSSVGSFSLGNTNVELLNIIQRCLSKDMGNRFQRVEELLEALIECYRQLFDTQLFLAALSPDEHIPAMDDIYLRVIPSIFVLIDATKSEMIEPASVVKFKKLCSEFSTYLELCKFEKARSIAQDMVSIYPGAAESYRCLGDILSAEENFDEAILQFTNALVKDHGHAGAYDDGRAKALWAIGRCSEAVEDITKAVENAPLDASPSVTRGFWQSQMDRFPEAMENLNAAIAMEINSPVAYTNRAYVYARIGEYERALEDYDAAVRINPNYAPDYLGRSGMLVALGKFEIAITDCEKVIELDNRCGEAYLQMGVAYQQMGREMIALECFDKAEKLGLGIELSQYSIDDEE